MHIHNYSIGFSIELIRDFNLLRIRTSTYEGTELELLHYKLYWDIITMAIIITLQFK